MSMLIWTNVKESTEETSGIGAKKKKNAFNLF